MENALLESMSVTGRLWKHVKMRASALRDMELTEEIDNETEGCEVSVLNTTCQRGVKGMIMGHDLPGRRGRRLRRKLLRYSRGVISICMTY